MTKPWHDINIPRHLSSQNKDFCGSKVIFTGVDEEYLPERKPTSVEYRIRRRPEIGGKEKTCYLNKNAGYYSLCSTKNRRNSGYAARVSART